MKILIDENNSMPNYQQIILQIKRLIIIGDLKPNEQLPSIRNLAKDLNVAIITIKRAYEELEKDGITYTLGGKGVYIKEIDPNNLKLDLITNIKGQFKEVIALAKYLNLSNEEILASFKEELFNE